MFAGLQAGLSEEVAQPVEIEATKAGLRLDQPNVAAEG